MNDKVSKTGLYITQKTKYFLFVMSIILLILLSLIFCTKTIHESISSSSLQAENIAQVLSSGIPEKVFAMYINDDSSLSDPLYGEIKLSMDRYIDENDIISSISIYAFKNGELSSFIKSGNETNSEISDIINDALKQSFEDGIVVKYIPIFKDIGDTDIFVTVPVRNYETGQVIGLFALLMNTGELRENIVSHLMLTIFISLLIITIYIGMVIALNKNNMLKDEKKKLAESIKTLSESEMVFRNIFEQAALGISINTVNQNLVTDLESITVNAAYERMTGYTKEQLMTKKWTEITHEDNLQKEQEMMSDFLRGNINGYQMEKKIIKSDGVVRWVNIKISGLHLDNQENLKYICTVEDIDDRKRMESSLYESERDKSILISNVPGMAFRCRYDKDWTMDFVSQGCFELTGYPAESFLGENKISYISLVNPKYDEFVRKKWKQAVISKSRCSIEYEICTLSGELKWVYEQGQAVYDKSGEPVAIEGLVIDIDKSKKQELELRYLTDHNPMTGLYSRSYFNYILKKEIEDGISGTKAVILINLRNFSLLNMTYGYDYAEDIIKELSIQLKMICSGNCQLFHISIDRFLLYIKGYDDWQILINMCNKIIDMMYDRFATKLVGGSLGVYELDPYMTDGEIVIRNASIAVEYADLTQVFSYEFFSNDMEKKIVRGTLIEDELVKAIYGDEDNRLHAVFQPVINLEDDSIEGFEALARFNSDILGDVPQSEFIPIAEEKQLITALSKKIIKYALQLLKKLESLGENKLMISVNISAIQLLREEFVGDMIDIVQKYTINPNRVILEITESMFADNYFEINKKLSLLQDAGFKIAIDDFGTGYSSLARESELNVNYIKIDKYFINKLLYVGEDQTITSEIISMSHKLGHYAIAEGVEQASQKEFLKKHGCDFMQGYLFSQPISMDDAIMLIKENHS